MRLYIFIIGLIIIFWSSTTECYAQSTTTLTYDASGNRISKKMQGSGPQPSVVASPQAVNPGQQVALSASGCPGTVQWSTGQQGANVTVTPTVTTQYSASCIVAGCTPGVGKITVEVIQCVLDEITVSASSTIVRYGQSITLIAYGCSGTVEWSTGQSGNAIITNVYGSATQFTATCKRFYCSNAGSASLWIGGISGCSTGDVIISKQVGDWNNPATWICGKVPTENDEVYINHQVSVTTICYAKQIIKGDGYLVYDTNGKVILP